MFICWCCRRKHKIERQIYSREEKNMMIRRRKQANANPCFFTRVTLNASRYLQTTKFFAFHSGRDERHCRKSIDIEQRLIIHSQRRRRTDSLKLHNSFIFKHNVASDLALMFFASSPPVNFNQIISLQRIFLWTFYRKSLFLTKIENGKANNATDSQ